LEAHDFIRAEFQRPSFGTRKQVTIRNVGESKILEPWKDETSEPFENSKF